MKQLKQKKCKHCKELFAPTNSMQKVCSPDCAFALVKTEKKATRKRETAKQREKLKTRSQHLREAQQAFNAYIRERDKDQPCISCQRRHGGKYDAGHFFSVGAHPDLRFNEDNCHKQCVPCNQHLSGNLHCYRDNLPVRIGQERFDALDAVRRDHKILKLTVDEIQAIKAKYRKKLRNLKKGVDPA